MTTLKDIARQLNLSPATVSRALNGFPEVKSQTRELVLQAATRLNYRPNLIAQKLVSGRSGMIGLILKPFEADAANASFFQVMSGISHYLADADLDLIFQTTIGHDILAPYSRMINKTKPDGFVLVGPEIDDPRIAFLHEQQIPFVVHGQTDSPDYAFYDIDNKLVASSVVNMLCNLGHSRIAMINGPKNYSFACQRQSGYVQAMLENGLSAPEFAHINGRQTSDLGYTSALSLLSGRRQLAPSAIICSSTIVADGVYRAAKDLNISIPQDLSVVAHDDAVPDMRAVNFEPALTVTRSPIRDASQPLAMAMRKLLEGDQPARLQTITKAELIVRNSTGPVPKEMNEPW